MGNVAHPIVRCRERNDRSKQIDVNAETKSGCGESISAETRLLARPQLKEEQ